MVFSVITGFYVAPVFLIFTNRIGCRYLENLKQEEPIGFPYAAILLSSVLTADVPVIDNTHTVLLLLFGMIQCAFLSNLSQILYGECRLMIFAFFARLTSTLFYFYLVARMLRCETILIPKLPLKLHWKSIILISLFFATTGFYMWPYCTDWNLKQHLYIYFLCIEASIYYYTKKFRLFCRYPRDDYFLYHKVYEITVYRKSVSFQEDPIKANPK